MSSPPISAPHNQQQGDHPTLTPSTEAHPQKKQKSNDTKAYLNALIGAHRVLLFVAFFLDMLSVITLMILAWKLAGVFDALIVLETKNSLNQQAKALILPALPWLGACLGVRVLLSMIREAILAKVGQKIAMDVRQSVLHALGRLGLARRYFGADGALASYVTHEPDALVGYARFWVQKMSAVSTPLLIFAVVAFYYLPVALILLATLPVLLFLMVFIGIRTAKKSREQMDALAQMGGRFLDWLRGLNTLVRIRALALAKKDIEAAASEYQRRTMQVLRVAFLNSTVLELFSALSIALVAIYLGFGLLGMLPWAKGEHLPSFYVALFILLLVPEFYAPLRKLGADYHAQSSAMAAATVLRPLTLANTLSRTKPKLLDTSIFLDKVSIVSNGRQRLNQVSLKIESGQRWALVGRSGAGKSSVFELLLGMSDYVGSAKIGQIEVRNCDMLALGGEIGYLAQTHALLPLSIRDNLKLANDSASTQMIEAVLVKVGLSELLQLPKGIDTLLGERGAGLSGGQAQRLALAQLLLQDAKIWLMDEPSEHLDEVTKTQIHDLIRVHSQGKTLLWATHDTPAPWLDGVYHLSAPSSEGVLG